MYLLSGNADLINEPYKLSVRFVCIFTVRTIEAFLCCHLLGANSQITSGANIPYKNIVQDVYMSVCMYV